MNLARNKLFFLVLLLYISSLETHFSKALDSITSSQSLIGNQTVFSQNGTFELGFFTPGNSRNYYIGIWYGRLPNKTVVWVANRDQPVSDPYTSELKLFPNGSLALLNQSKHIIWTTNSTSELANSTIAKLLDTGNFVVREEADSSKMVWQSFDYPTDTWLPGGKIGYNKLRNEKLTLTSWRSTENPASSLFSVQVEPNGTSHLLVWNESQVYWTSGEWTGSVFALVPEIALDLYVRNFTYISNENESYFTYDAGFPNALTRFLIDESGRLRQFVWGPGFSEWSQFWLRPSQPCQVYGLCGAFSSCNEVRAPTCNCIRGFEPGSLKDWESGDHSQGCRMKIPLKCNTGGNDTFSLVPNTRFPANSESHTVGTSEECELACLKNCSCSAYAYDNGCFLWSGKLIDLKEVNDNTGKEFHVRVAASEDMLVREVNTKRKTKSNAVWIVVGAMGGFSAIIAIVLMTICARRRGKRSTLLADGSTLVVFKHQDLRSATKNFSEKLGEGGFGTVFKGTLPSSSTIAVKRLKSLTQEEKHDKQFRAEVSTIGLIQHINLVRLLGFSTKGTKRFLVYEFMTNGSLESHLFQKKYVGVLDWKTRYHIIIGTARGLSYLHEKCRDCIIHCDIKPDNILLDSDFNPKVADFGLAKLMGREFSRVLTTMRGTRGYLAPEWISGEAITPKADVFSYGMLLFEVISGKRNRDLLDDGTDDYFPARVAYRVAQGEGLVNLLDERLGGDANVEELARACKIACWCVQDDEKNRPTMGQIVQVLEGATEVGIPPIPQFFQGLLESPVEPLVYILSSSSQV